MRVPAGPPGGVRLADAVDFGAYGLGPCDLVTQEGRQVPPVWEARVEFVGDELREPAGRLGYGHRASSRGSASCTLVPAGAPPPPSTSIGAGSSSIRASSRLVSSMSSNDMAQR